MAAAKSEFVRSLFPALSGASHKGQCGRVGVLGGSKEYTGAPYFAAISALRMGADLAHVFCPPDAAPVIKSYSPELIVHPLLGLVEKVSEVQQWMERLHAVIIGPGLGRDQSLVPFLEEIMEEIRNSGKPLIVDADGLFFVTQNRNLVSFYENAILTPNAMEFVYLFRATLGREPNSNAAPGDSIRELSKRLGNVTIVKKGAVDEISDGERVSFCEGGGSARRCGGQGDLLSGALGTLAAWRYINAPNETDKWEAMSRWMAAAYGACFLCRCCNEAAFNQLGRSATTTDMVDAIPKVLHQLQI